MKKIFFLACILSIFAAFTAQAGSTPLNDYDWDKTSGDSSKK